MKRKTRYLNTSLCCVDIHYFPKKMFHGKGSGELDLKKSGYVVDPIYQFDKKLYVAWEYPYAKLEELRHIKKVIEIAETKNVFGVYFTFVCPIECGRNADKLYISSDGTGIGCRRCMNVYYKSSVSNGLVSKMMKNPELMHQAITKGSEKDFAKAVKAMAYLDEDLLKYTIANPLKATNIKALITYKNNRELIDKRQDDLLEFEQARLLELYSRC